MGMDGRIFRRFTVRVLKWGDHLAVRVPESVVDAHRLQEGDDIVIVIDDSLRFAVAQKLTSAERLCRLRAFRGRMPADVRFSRDEANSRS